MKRALAKTIEGESFFKLDEAIEILCCSSPHPAFIATLIQLSKVTRRYVWDFLIDQDKCTQLWYDEFSKQLWSYKDLRPLREVTYFNLHPVFVIGKGKFQSDRYHIGKVLVKPPLWWMNNGEKITLATVEGDVLVGGCYSYFPDAKISYPGWDLMTRIKWETLFEWYFVACALTLRIDRMVTQNALNRWKEDPITPHDTTLYIAYKEK